jgi:hypothetical protein
LRKIGEAVTNNVVFGIMKEYQQEYIAAGVGIIVIFFAGKNNSERFYFKKYNHEKQG